jgi:uncharacterized protein YciI
MSDRIPVTHYVYRIQPTRPDMLRSGPTPEEDEILARHFSYLKGLTERGVVTLAGRTLIQDERSFGLVILRADSEEAARELMNNDPAVKHGIMRAELDPFRIALLGGS